MWMIRNCIYSLLYILGKFIFNGILYNTRILGFKNIPKGRIIFESNYSSPIDPLFIFFAGKRRVYSIIPNKKKSPYLLRFILKLFNCIEEPEDKTSSEYMIFLRKVKELLSKHKIICFFPENEITKNGFIGKFYQKPTDITVDGEHLQIVPVYIGPALRGKEGYGKNIRRKGFITICFGKPLLWNSEPYKIRNAIMELSAEASLLPNYKERTLHYKFLSYAKLHLSKKILQDNGERELGAFEILLKALLLSKMIRKLKKESKFVGVLLPNSTIASISTLSVMYADLAPAMLNFTMAPFIFKEAIINSGIDLIITSRKFVEKIKFETTDEMIFLEDLAGNITFWKKILYVILLLFLPAFVLIRLFSYRSYKNLDNTAVLLFSSGSSGFPKGIMLSHHNVNSNVNSFINIMKMDSTHDRITGCLPLFHSFGMNICFWVPLMYGIKVVYTKNPLDIDDVIASIREWKLTLLATTPTILNAYLKKAEKTDFKSLRLLILGGEKFNATNIKEIQESIGIEPIEGYGATELSPVVSINIADDINIRSGKFGSVGKSLPGIASKIVHQDTFEDMLPGQLGFLVIKAACVMKGYLSSEATEKVMINDWYNTYDIASIDEEGYITIVGRVSRFSKIAGEMISHELIENLIYEYLNTSEKLVAVSGIKDSMKGERLIVFYTDKKLDPHDIIIFLHGKGLSNLWVPKPKDFVKIHSIPLLGSGKIDFEKLNDISSRLNDA